MRTPTLEEARAVLERHNEVEKEKQHAEVVARCVGRFYRYHNSYGGGDDAKRWWMYFAVTEVEDWTCACIGLEFQTDSGGKIEIDPRARHYVHKHDSWIEISREEFTLAAQAIGASAVGALLAPPAPVTAKGTAKRAKSRKVKRVNPSTANSRGGT